MTRAAQALRRYILGLALVAFTAPQESYLRQGCELVADPEKPAKWEIVNYDGKRKPFAVTSTDAFSYASVAREAFKPAANREATFDAATARAALGQSKEERKAGRRRSRSGGQ